MSDALKISAGQYSDRGRKSANQDFHGLLVPKEPLLSLKGIAVAIADGISTSPVAHIASESAVKSFLTDYYCTPETWSVKTAAHRVIAATNSWLHAQTRRGAPGEDRDRGYICTFSAIVIKASTAHLFHIGDSRIYRVAGSALEQLTEDHRVVVSSVQSYLGRALGVKPQVEIDHRSLEVSPGDIFVLATDGVFDHVSARFVAQTIASSPDLDRAARTVVEEALRCGSNDNLTIQIVRIESVSSGEADAVLEHEIDLPLPPLLEAPCSFDGYRIVRELHASSRSHVYLALDEAHATGARPIVLKIPSIDLRGDPAYLRRFVMEEWIARRIDNAHVLRPQPRMRRRGFLYVAMEHVEGQTLAQWMMDNPRPDLERVRGIVEQIGRGLQAFHRLEMIHQDLRPENVMIDRTGTVKIIDFGSVHVRGIAEAVSAMDEREILGTHQYAAPEYFLGEGGSQASDIYSLGVIAYQMISGRLPYGAEAARIRSRSQLRKLTYSSVLDEQREVPAWIDWALRKAVQPDPANRYAELSEFLFDLRHPSAGHQRATRAPLLARDPLLFWKGLSTALAVALAAMLFHRFS
ncbi:MAG: protein kinase [Alphaproteobacteria bacterium]|nr:protein kinase [Alphaproteobacteria bacterium]